MKTCRQSCCIGAFIWAVTGLLGLLLLLQGAILSVIVFGSAVPLPAERIARWINGQIDGGYAVSFDRILIDRNALLRIDGISIHDTRGNLPAMRIESFAINFFAPGLILGQVQPEQVSARGLVLYEYADRLDPPEPILEVPALSLRSTRNAWEIEDAVASVGNITLMGYGLLDPEILRELPSADPSLRPGRFPESTLRSGHRLATGAIEFLRDATDSFIDPSIFFELRPGSYGQKEIRWNIAVPRASPLPGVEVEGFELSGRTLLSRTSVDTVLDSRLRQVETSEAAIHQADWRARIHYQPEDEETLTVSEIQIAADRVDFGRETLSGLVVDIDHPTGGRILADGSFFHRSNPIQFSTDIETRSLSGIINLESRIDPFVALESFPEIRDPLHRYLRLDGPFDFQATAFLRPGGIPESVGFFLDSGPIDVLGMHGQRLIGEGHLDAKGLTVREFAFDTRRYNLSGNFSVDFTNSDWRVSFTGGAEPLDLAGWFEPWWKNLWSRFEFSSPPQVDFRIRGNGVARQDRDIFGELRLPPTLLSEFPIDRARALVWGDERFLTIAISDALAPAGTLRGSLYYFYNHHRNLLVARAYDFSTRLVLPDEFKVMGEAVGDLVDTFEPTGPVGLEVRGVIVSPEARPSLRHHESLNVRARTESPVQVAGITLDDLYFRARYARHIAKVSPIEFGLGSGRGGGWLNWQGKEQPELSFEFRLEDSDPRKVLQSIEILRDADPFRGDGETSSDSAERDFDLFARLSGDPEAPMNFSGDITASLRSPDLGEVRVFGILSRLFAAAPPPFNIGSIRFNQLEIAAKLADGNADFTRFDLYSPSTRVKATGSYALPSGRVEMQLRVYLFQEISTPLIGWAAQIFKPLARILVFNLGGTVNAKTIDLRLNPSGTTNDEERSRR